MEDTGSSRQVRVYEIERLLATGGVGSVYLAHHQITHMPVALKVIRGHSRNPEAQRARFLREVRAAARIGHPGIVRVYDAGETEEGDLFLAMELLEGRSLEDAFAQESSAQVRTGWMAKILEPLKAAHNEGIVHRDLKPANVFLAETSAGLQVKLLDFGIAADARDGRVTQTGMMLGTPYYMSPEQALTPSQVGPASDIWSFGVMLYEALTGEVPFVGETPHTVVVSASSDPHPPLLEKLPDLMPALSSLVDACLEKDPEQRLSDASVVLARLQPILRDTGFDENMAHLSTVRALAVPRPPTARGEAGVNRDVAESAVSALRADSAASGLWMEGPALAPSLDDLDTVAPLDVSLRRARRRRSGWMWLLLWVFAVFASILLLGLGQNLMQRTGLRRQSATAVEMAPLEPSPTVEPAPSLLEKSPLATAPAGADSRRRPREAMPSRPRTSGARPEATVAAVRPGSTSARRSAARAVPNVGGDGSDRPSAHAKATSSRPPESSAEPRTRGSQGSGLPAKTPAGAGPVGPEPQGVGRQEVIEDDSAAAPRVSSAQPSPAAAPAADSSTPSPAAPSLSDAGVPPEASHLGPPAPVPAPPVPAPPALSEPSGTSQSPAPVPAPSGPGLGAAQVPAPTPSPGVPAPGAEAAEPEVLSTPDSTPDHDRVGDGLPQPSWTQAQPLPEGPAPLPMVPTFSRWADEPVPQDP